MRILSIVQFSRIQRDMISHSFCQELMVLTFCISPLFPLWILDTCFLLSFVAFLQLFCKMPVIRSQIEELQVCSIRSMQGKLGPDVHSSFIAPHRPKISSCRNRHPRSAGQLPCMTEHESNLKEREREREREREKGRKGEREKGRKGEREREKTSHFNPVDILRTLCKRQQGITGHYKLQMVHLSLQTMRCNHAV